MYKNILVPVDLEHNRDMSDVFAVARKLLDDGGQITALHVIEAIPGYVALNLPADYQETRREQAAAAMKTELGGDESIKMAVVVGHAGRSIQDYSEEHNHDCLIMASHRPGVQDYFLGSTASWVVRHSQCSVHVMR